jgi:hypothetical protein
MCFGGEGLGEEDSQGNGDGEMVEGVSFCFVFVCFICL